MSSTSNVFGDGRVNSHLKQVFEDELRSSWWVVYVS